MLGIVLHHIASGSANALKIFCDVSKVKTAALFGTNPAPQGGLTHSGVHLKRSTNGSQIALELVDGQVCFWNFGEHS